MTSLIQLFLSTLLFTMSAQARVSSRTAARSINDHDFILDSDHSRDELRRLAPFEVFQVPMLLSIKYLNNETASELETLDSKNVFVHSFCSIVQKQAGGNQVNAVIKEAGISIKTAPASNTTTECVIIDTHRVNTTTEALGADYFTLELSILQRVYVTSGEALNLTTVQGLVENGFNRGYGGRALFLSLLRASDLAYNLTLADVDVLDVFISSLTVDPTKAPTTTVPTMSPTLLYSVSPSTTKTNTPSIQPTGLPSALPSFVAFNDTSSPFGTAPTRPLFNTTSAPVTANTSKTTLAPIQTSAPTSAPVLETLAPIIDTSAPTGAPVMSTPAPALTSSATCVLNFISSMIIATIAVAAVM